MFDWVGTYVAIGLLFIIFFIVFYPTFEEWYTKLWEEIDRIKRKFEEETEEAW